VSRIYLDWAATTTVRDEVVDVMVPLLRGGYNPSSLHADGRAARAVLDDARDDVARVLGASPREIVFTSSGTESDALALLGVARARSSPGHLVISAIEHMAVQRTADVLAEEGWEVTRVGVSPDGVVDPAAVAAAIRPDTALVSVMLANNELGTIQPVAAVAAIARARGIPVHSDAVQAAGYLPLDVDRLGVDLLTLSAHKLGGPKGVGALYVRRGTLLAPQLVGGPQEHGLRAGTEDLAGIAGFARGLALAEAERVPTAARIAELREQLERLLLAAIPDGVVLGHNVGRLPHLTLFAVAGVPNDALLIALDLEGVSASAGSACAAGSLEPSHVVAALGIPAPLARGVIRLSLGRTTTAAEIERAAGIVLAAVTRMRPSGLIV
jgi:cysteine desulfurase